MAAAEARAVWQRTATNRAVQEDVVKAPKLAHCPSLKKQDSHSYYLGSSWGSMDTKVDLPRQLNPSTHRDYRSDYLGVEDVLGSRFKPGLQALAAERGSTKNGSPGYMGLPSEYSVGNEVDLGWQFVLDPKPKSGYPSETGVLDQKFEEDNIAASLVDEDGEPALVGDNEPIDLSVMAQEILTKTVQEFADQSSISSLDVEEPAKKLDSVNTHGKKEIDYTVTEQSTEFLPISTWSSTNSPSSKVGSSWRTADKEALAVLVAQKTSEKLENCDLPTPRSGFKCKTSLDSWDVLEESSLDVSKSLDRDLLSSVFQDGELSRLENLGLQSNSTYSRPEPNATAIPLATTEPLNISGGPSMPAHRHLSKSYSADNRNTSWSGGGGGTVSFSNKGSSPLVEALCHSQTRAREAEQKVEQATKEYKKLSDLFFREASLSMTYRHWICSLQAENTWLKMCIKNQQGATWLKHSFPSASAVLDHLSKTPWRHFKKENIHRQMLRHFSALWRSRDSISTAKNARDDTSIILGCTIGFAFALGLTLAGAGLVLGWRMGWIILPC
ncbi:hypothetical protein KC19_5G002400 [Ceratodon purpureus]|uniref:Uncharacterized protein n=1 Tax=Ceratodon purpureus TaxID=3225 RepID=A0A8T0HXA9_CERPU|nr:hypothetical protein KC19_5G002400 [Ceratodon purpureus]